MKDCTTDGKRRWQKQIIIFQNRMKLKIAELLKASLSMSVRYNQLLYMNCVSKCKFERKWNYELHFEKIQKDKKQYQLNYRLIEIMKCLRNIVWIYRSWRDFIKIEGLGIMREKWKTVRRMTNEVNLPIYKQSIWFSMIFSTVMIYFLDDQVYLFDIQGVDGHRFEHINNLRMKNKKL